MAGGTVDGAAHGVAGGTGDAGTGTGTGTGGGGPQPAGGCWGGLG